MIQKRKLMRQKLHEQLLCVIHEDYHFNGSAELLQIMITIIQGFTVPLKQEHIDFFRTILMPLYKVQNFHMLSGPLYECCIIFLRKDERLTLDMVDGLLRYWPRGHVSKENYFLPLLCDIMENCNRDLLKFRIDRIFSKLAECLLNDNTQIQDSALIYFKNFNFISLMNTYQNQTFTILAPAIYKVQNTVDNQIKIGSNSVPRAILSLKDETLKDVITKMNQINSHKL